MTLLGLDNDTDELLDLISRRDHRHPQLNAHSPQLNAHSPPPTPPHHHTLYEEAQEDSRGSSHFTQTPIPRTGYTVDHERGGWCVCVCVYVTVVVVVVVVEMSLLKID